MIRNWYYILVATATLLRCTLATYIYTNFCQLGPAESDCWPFNKVAALTKICLIRLYEKYLENFQTWPL